jgi:hypothetical protein
MVGGSGVAVASSGISVEVGTLVVSVGVAVQAERPRGRKINNITAKRKKFSFERISPSRNQFCPAGSRYL